MHVCRASRALFAIVCVLGMAQCSRPNPPFRVHRVEALGLTVTLPGDWRGGSVRGAGHIYSSGPANCSLILAEGHPTGIAISEAGARTFVAERLATTVLSTGRRTVGQIAVLEATGANSAPPRHYVGFLSMPERRAWVHLTTSGLEPRAADALWTSIIGSLRLR